MIRSVQTSFNNGAVSASMRSRIDNPAYKNSAAEIVNCRAKPQGGQTRRAGMVALAELPATPSYQVEEFVFSSTQAYTVILSAGRADIWNKNTRSFAMFLTGCPWTEAHIASEQVQVSQEYDTMIVAHPDFETQLIKRIGFAAFTLTPLKWWVDLNNVPHLPFHKYAPANMQMSVSNLTPGAVATVSLDGNYFVAGHVGLWFQFGTGKAPMQCIAVATPSVATMIVSNYGPPTFTTPGGPDPEWAEQAFSPLHGWIRCTCFHEERLALGGGRDIPNAVWLSSTTNPFDMDLAEGRDSDAIKYLIHSDRVVEIVTMVSQINLQIFAAHAEFVVPWLANTALTPANFSVKKQSGYGIKSTWAKPFDQSTLFISRTAFAVREFNIQAASLIESYSADSISFMAEDIIVDPVDLDVQLEGIGSQDSIGYVTNGDGTMAVLSRVKKESIGGWGSWTTEGRFLRCGVIDREAWLIVERLVAGTTRRFIEVLDPGAMMDFSASWTGPASTTIGPFPLHVGATVHVISGNLYFGEFAVPSSGLIVLPIAVTHAEVGFNFVPRIVPLTTEVQMPDGFSVGIPKRVVRTVADFQDTISATVGGRSLNTSTPDSDPGLAPPALTGQLECWHLGWGKQPLVVISSPLPLPFTIRSLMQEVEV